MACGATKQVVLLFSVLWTAKLAIIDEGWRACSAMIDVCYGRKFQESV